MKLDPRFKKILAEKLEGVLAGITVYGGILGYQDTDTIDGIDRSFASGDVASLKEYISENPFADFLDDYLRKKVSAEGFLYADGCALSAINGFSDLAALSGEIIDAIEAVPHTYAFSIPLPQTLNSQFQSSGLWELSERIHIGKGEHLHRAYDVPSLTNGKGQNFGKGHAIMVVNNAHLVVRGTGYVLGREMSHPYHRALEDIRAMFGLMLALGLVRLNYLPATSDNEMWITLNRQVGGVFRYEGTFRLDSAWSHVLSRLVFPPTNPAVPPQWAYAVGRHLTTLEYILASEKHGRRLKLAAQWFFDSYAGDNQLLQYVQAMVALEILVGGTKDENADVGIGKLMRNRIAYLIGRSIEEREQIMKTFDAIYAVRSNIVHAGYSRLTGEQLDQLVVLQEYVARVIAAEAKLITPDDAYEMTFWVKATADLEEPEEPEVAPAPKWEPGPPGPVPEWVTKHSKPATDEAAS